ncbi:MAG TPA: hypothetical protein VK444_02725 [Methanobacteriaceae archaeon]|nr:hypothetical protein [Methanobacteriaceae archaeon]
MKPQKTGKLFIVLLIALVAYGFASGAHALGVATDLGTDLIPSDLNLAGDQKISEISDPSFKQVYIIRKALNITNTTNSTVKNASGNQTP